LTNMVNTMSTAKDQQNQKTRRQSGNVSPSFLLFLSWGTNNQLDHWTKRMVRM